MLGALSCPVHQVLVPPNPLPAYPSLSCRQKFLVM